MSDPWLSIIGIGEDGFSGLSEASRNALAQAEFVFGGPRHLELAGVGARGQPWPVPFTISPVIALRGRKVAVLASGDPFWYGAGGSIAQHLDVGEWQTFPSPSAFSLAAAQLGWRLEEAVCLGLHATPFGRVLPHLSRGQRLICLVRDGATVSDFANWLTRRGYGTSKLWVMEALGGPRERIRTTKAAALSFEDIRVPVAVAIEAVGGPGLQRTSGLPDDAFVHDGQITKRAVRAVTLSSLAPRRGEHLWDIGGGSGSISIEWALAGGTASSIEPRLERAEMIRTNAAEFGLSKVIGVVEGRAPEALEDLPEPDAVFIGGGGSEKLFQWLWNRLPSGTRLVANAVTLESEALFSAWHARCGGTLMRIETAESQPLGSKRGWVPARPIVQWSVVR